MCSACAHTHIQTCTADRCTPSKLGEPQLKSGHIDTPSRNIACCAAPSYGLTPSSVYGLGDSPRWGCVEPQWRSASKQPPSRRNQNTSRSLLPHFPRASRKPSAGVGAQVAMQPTPTVPCPVEADITCQQSCDTTPPTMRSLQRTSELHDEAMDERDSVSAGLVQKTCKFTCTGQRRRVRCVCIQGKACVYADLSKAMRTTSHICVASECDCRDFAHPVCALAHIAQSAQR